jgi:diguanylate cyclase (GGDEF)-like protein
MKIYDDLTGLYNGEGFYGKVEEYLERHKEDEKYQIIRFDIKNFKFVNAIFGRRSGNMLLAEIGDTLKGNQYPEEICGRMDSDRFVVFVPAKYSASLIELIMETKFQVKDSNAYPVHICAGIYNIKCNECSVSEMCDRAGMALSSGKGNLLEKVSVYDDDMYEKMLKEHELSQELPQALEEGQLQFYLQPQNDKSGKVVGAEALVRWLHPVRGLLMPGEFIPMFERNYMVVEIDRYIWEKACQKLREWEDDGKDDIYISVNISPKDFECIDVYEVLVNLVKKYEINANQLKVEITEGTIMQNPMEQIKLIGRLRNAGFYVEMDDFGSGYSSISMLKDIDIDAVKLDMRFFSKTAHIERACKIIKSVIRLIRDFDMTVIAEGVETKEQLEFLTEIGCDMFQGYYFSKPVPVDEFEEKNFTHRT